MNFAKKLKNLRIDKGYTQRYMYTKLGTSPNCYASYEQGRTEPNLNTLKQICILLEISADYLLGIEDELGNKTYNNTYNNYGTHKGDVSF